MLHLRTLVGRGTDGASVSIKVSERGFRRICRGCFGLGVMHTGWNWHQKVGSRKNASMIYKKLPKKTRELVSIVEELKEVFELPGLLLFVYKDRGGSIIREELFKGLLTDAVRISTIRIHFLKIVASK